MAYVAMHNAIVSDANTLLYFSNADMVELIRILAICQAVFKIDSPFLHSVWVHLYIFTIMYLKIPGFDASKDKHLPLSLTPNICAECQE